MDYKNGDKTYSIVIPDGWEEIEASSSYITNLMIFIPMGEMARVSIAVRKCKEPMKSRAKRHGIIKDRIQKLKPSRLDEKSNFILDHEENTICFEYMISNGGNYRYISCVHGEKEYEIETLDKTIFRYEKAIDSMMNSFTFLDKN